MEKKGKNTQKSKEFLAKERSKEFPKNKERKIRVLHPPLTTGNFPGPRLPNTRTIQRVRGLWHQQRTPTTGKLPCNTICPLTFSQSRTLQKCEVNFFSVFLCQRCREIWREIFRVLRFPGFEYRKHHAKNGVKNGKFHANFTLLERGADIFHVLKRCHVTPPFKSPCCTLLFSARWQSVSQAQLPLDGSRYRGVLQLHCRRSSYMGDRFFKFIQCQYWEELRSLYEVAKLQPSWERAKVSHKRMFALLTPEIRS